MQYSDAVKEARGQAVIDAIGSSGVLEIGDSGFGAVLATISLDDPAGTVDSSGVITFTVPRNNTIDQSGSAAEARILDGDSNDIITGLTVGESDTEIIVSTVDFVETETFTLTAAGITPA